LLVLTRRAGESIMIGDDVRVVVLDVRGDTVRLGIEAPRSIQVHRAEVYAEVQAANAAAVNRTDDLESLAGRLQRMARPVAPRRSGATPAPARTPGGATRTSSPPPVTGSEPSGAGAPRPEPEPAEAPPAPRPAPDGPTIPQPSQPPVRPGRPVPGPPR
jgi:carbon storage regulator